MLGAPRDVLPTGVFLASVVRRAELDSFLLAQWTAACVQHIEPHVHAEAHFMLITSGRYATTARGECASGGLLIFNPPGTSHQDHLETGGAFFTVTLAAQMSREGGADMLPAGPIQIATPGPHALMRRLLRELSQWETDSDLHAESLCHELIAATAGLPTPRAAPGWLHRAREYLDDAYAYSVSLAAVSRAVGVHPHHLTRAFRSFYSCTPGEYLRARRLDEAAQRLSGTGRRIADIALETGFGDQPHFSRRFGRAYGLSPVQYRRMTRGSQD